ncbi:MAG: carboxypeptidase regulatory-like domain-containing protein [Burkholderiales bacterium]|nr:carboxypeptidase regulatory-like domain-containing protein [Burkholderiales bacterium]
MKQFSKTMAAAFAVANIAAAFPALAAASATMLPPEKTEAGIVYRTGGIGKDEVAQFKRIEPQYPLALEFLGKPRSDGMHPEYLADVKVTISDAQHGKTVFSTTATGPFLVAKLAPGKYTVSAEYQGNTHHRTVEVHAKRSETVVFEWNA